MTTKVNKVSVEKASANAKANSLIALDVLKSVKEKNQGLFKTALGTKTEIYKKELFLGANEKQIKSLRKNSEMLLLIFFLRLQRMRIKN